MASLCQPVAAAPLTRSLTALPGTAAPIWVGKKKRILALDMVRGIALLVMLSNHLTANPWAVITFRPLGFFTAADIFVFTSGVSAGLKYYRLFAAGGMPRVLTAILRSWFLILAACAALPIWSNYGGLLHPYLLYWGLIAVLAPVCARGGHRLVLTVSLIGWLAAFYFHLPGRLGHWGFNPLSWQLLFCLGFTFGEGKASSRNVWPRHHGLLLILGAVATGFFFVRHSGVDPMSRLFDGSPCIAPLRLLNFLVAAYLCYHLLRIPDRWAKPFARLGRNGLWLFIWHTVLVMGWETWHIASLAGLPRLVIAAACFGSYWLVAPVVEAFRSFLYADSLVTLRLWGRRRVYR